MITLEALAAGRAPLALSDVSLTWGPGVHSLLGSAGDGGPLLLGVLAGAERVRAGSVRVLDGAPGQPGVRRQVAFVPLNAVIPADATVGETLDIAAEIRGDPPKTARQRLEPLGIEALAARRTETLSREETRAVALAEALSSSVVRVLLLEEPFLRLDPRAASQLAGALRASSTEDRAILLATASMRDAGELADDHVFLRAGAVVAQTRSLDRLAGIAPGGARIRISTRDPRGLAAVLAREEGVEAVARREGSLIARGRDPMELARAAARAILAAGVDLTELSLEALPLDEARNAALLSPPPGGRGA